MIYLLGGSGYVGQAYQALLTRKGIPFRNLRRADLDYTDVAKLAAALKADPPEFLINAAGYKVWPAELEAMLYKHPGIKEVAIVSAPDERRGETVKAYVVMKEAAPAVTPEEIIGWCRQHMAAYKVPRLVEFSDALPRSPTGKIQWRTLQDKEWASR